MLLHPMASILVLLKTIIYQTYNFTNYFTILKYFQPIIFYFILIYFFNFNFLLFIILKEIQTLIALLINLFSSIHNIINLFFIKKTKNIKLFDIVALIAIRIYFLITSFLTPIANPVFFSQLGLN